MITNLTPHKVVVFTNGNYLDTTTTFLPHGTVARVATSLTHAGKLAGVNIFNQTFGKVEDLPAPSEGQYYIVSALVKSACPDRKDLLVPCDFVRDDNGNIIGCRGFSIGEVK